MIKKLKNKLTIRNGFITGTILIVLFNLVFLGIYYRIYLNEKINKNYIQTTKVMEEEITNLSTNLVNSSNMEEVFTEYIKNNKDTTITIKDDQNNLVKTYSIDEKSQNKNNIVVSNIITYQDNNYLLTLYKQKDVFSFKMVVHFFVFEIAIILFLGILGMSGANFKIFEPITSLSKDFNNYKLGILPKKRRIHGGIDSLQNDFVDLVDTLEEEKKKQNRIIASISHDIKTPLTSILGYSQRLLTSDSLSDETKKKYASTIYSKSLVMKEITEEFDDYLSCNIKDEKKEEKISIETLIDYLNNYYKEDLKEKEIEFKVKTDCPNLYILVDLPKFKRIFSNTITNSIRHLDSNKKMLNINIFEQKDGKIKFEIADNGTGCNEDLEKIFEPLYTTDSSRKISGLGLSICREIVLSHGGTIKAENNKFGGFSIIFTIDSYKEK